MGFTTEAKRKQMDNAITCEIMGNQLAVVKPTPVNPDYPVTPAMPAAAAITPAPPLALEAPPTITFPDEHFFGIDIDEFDVDMSENANIPNTSAVARNNDVIESANMTNTCTVARDVPPFYAQPAIQNCNVTINYNFYNK